MGEIPEFAAYSIADGLKRAFTRFGKWIMHFHNQKMGKLQLTPKMKTAFYPRRNLSVAWRQSPFPQPTLEGYFYRTESS